MSKLTLRDRVRIDAPPESVWRILEDPQQATAWNSKLESVEPISQGPRRVGYQYRAVYEMQGGGGTMLAEIEEYQAPVRLVIVERGGQLAPEGRARHEYDLVPRGGGTLLRQKTTLIDSGLPLLVRLVIKFIDVFGSPAGETNLQELKELVENAP